MISFYIGLAAGLSMMLYRSTSLSLYVAWKAMEVGTDNASSLHRVACPY